jgi:hypothetical protein
MLADGQVPPSVEIQRLRDELGQFKKQTDEQQVRAEEDKKRQAEAQEQKAITDFKTEIGSYVDDNKVRYELINHEQATELVFDVVDEHYRRTIDPSTGAVEVALSKI